MNYYLSENASRPLVVGDRNIQFDRLAPLGGVVFGVYATEDEEEIAVLDEIVEQKKSVSAITQSEYDDLKKKVVSGNSQTPSPQPISYAPQNPAADKKVEVKDLDDAKGVESVDDLLNGEDADKTNDESVGDLLNDKTEPEVVEPTEPEVDSEPAEPDEDDEEDALPPNVGGELELEDEDEDDDNPEK